MSKDDLDLQLQIASEALREELRGVPGLSMKRKFKSELSDTRGRYTDIATLPRGLKLQLWLDKAAGDDRHRFYIGFSFGSAKQLDAFLGKAPQDMLPHSNKRTLREKDWKPLGRDSYAYLESREEFLSAPYLERYPKWGTHFFGLYDWGGHGSKSTSDLDVYKAKMFIKNVVEVLGEGKGNTRKIVDPEVRQLIENAATKMVKKHFKTQVPPYSIISREADCIGWDFEARRGKELLKLEVKGLKGRVASVEVTPNEYNAMKKDRKRFRLCIVTNALEDQRAKLRIFRYENGWRNEESESLEIEELMAARITVV